MTGIERAIASNGSAIVDASADRTGRVFATAHGIERVVRIWDKMGGGELALRAELRPPRTATAFNQDLVVGAINQEHVRSEGTIQSVSLSPDGRLLAIAGDFGASFGEDAYVFVYGMDSNSLVRTLRFRGTATRAVRFSPDGRTLLVGVAEVDPTPERRAFHAMHGSEALQAERTLPPARHGLVVIDSTTWSTISSNSTFSFAPWDVQVAADGSAMVLLVGGQLLHFASIRNLAGTPRSFGAVSRASSFAYARNGRFAIIAGHGPGERSDRLLVLEVSTGRVSTGVESSEFAPSGNRSVALSTDMRTVMAIGTVRDARGSGRVDPAAFFLNLQSGARITQYLGNASANAVVAAADDTAITFGRFDYREIRIVPGTREGQARSTTVASNHRQTLAYHSSHCDRFRVSADGEVIDFLAYTTEISRESGGNFSSRMNQRAFSLSTAERRVVVGGRHANAANVFGAPPVRSRIEVQNGRIVVDGQSISSAVRVDAVSSAGGNAVLIAGVHTQAGHLILWDPARGDLRWSTNLEDTVVCLNATRDGRYAIALHSDGAVRWYDMRNGAVALTFLPTANADRWVAWTPSGNYMASPGGGDLIGLRVNRRADQLADFIPMSRFGDRFENPNLVLAALRDRDERGAFARLLAEAATAPQAAAPASAPAPPRELPSIDRLPGIPPIVTILSPRNELQARTAEQSIKVRIRSSGGAALREVVIRVGNDEVDNFTVRLPPDGGEVEVARNIVVPRRDGVISVVARNNFGTGEPAVLPFRWTGPPDTARPRLFVLAIGVGAYRDPNIRPLRFPAKDARDFADAFVRQQGQVYRSVSVTTLGDREATRERVVAAIAALRQSVEAGDVVALFVAGHGFVLPNNEYYLALHDSNAADLHNTGLRAAELRDLTLTLRGRLAMLFIDACHAGAADGRQAVAGARARGLQPIEVDRFVNQMARLDNGVVVFASSTGTQLSLELDRLQNGVFTRAVVEGLDGAADVDRNGAVTISELELYVHRRVDNETQGQQTPTTHKPRTIVDAPIAFRRTAALRHDFAAR